MQTLNTSNAPHIPKKHSVFDVMLWVMIALIPAILAYMYHFGVGILLQIALSLIFALLFEFLSLKLLKRPVGMFLKDGSAMVTALLFALCISPLAPWYVSCVGMFFAIVVAKHLYGGLGQNIFNPAMVGFATVLIAFPQSMTHWLNPELNLWSALSFHDLTQIIFASQNLELYDSITAATPLDKIKSSLLQGYSISEVQSLPIFGGFGAKGWEWIACFYCIGGLLLIHKRIITWRIPCVVIVSTILVSLPLYVYDSDQFISPLQHLFSGGILLAAFFIATDPTSGCSSPKGQILFAFGVALITYVIREFGNYPDGVAFAVLLMNLSAPLMDRLTIPQPYGKKS